MNEFENMPKLSLKMEKHLTSGFTPYLFFEILKKGKRKYVCTHCGETFYEGEKVLTQTLTPEDRELWHAKHRGNAICPKCKTKATVINLKIKSAKFFNEYKYVCVLLANAYDDVWIRGFEIGKKYGIRNAGDTEFKEGERYHLRPGSAEHWRTEYFTENWQKECRPYEAFTYNHGLWTEKYDYNCISDETNIEDTFLKYNSFYRYSEYKFFNAPFIKYLCWYAIHPQIEMLSKMGHFETISQMVNKNSDMPSILNWNAKNPFELYGLPKQIYDYWNCELTHNLDLLKIYKALHGNKAKDFNTAKILYKFNNERLGDTKKLIALAKRLKVTSKQIVKYCQKIADSSAGLCHHCVGITSNEAYQMWRDYLSMAENAGIKNISTFPSNLKAAHDSLIAAERLKNIESNKKEIKAKAKREAKEILKRFPKIEDIYKSIKNKYSYANEKYSIIVPEKVEELVINNIALRLCMDRHDRYYERINTKESFILFLRLSDKPDTPWYTLEVEPSGTVRQKRTFGDVQDEALNEAMPFILEWQKILKGRLNKSDKKLADRSKILRNEHFEELKQSKKKINYGELQGKYLLDILQQDLLEAEETA